MKFAGGLLLGLALLASPAGAQSVAIDTSVRAQTIDGFGTCITGAEPQQAWWQDLYFDDLGASILRMDIVPRFKSPYSDDLYNSPWFGNKTELPGPEGNNVRTYTSAADYGKEWAGRKAAIAVMGPDIDKNSAYFDYDDDNSKSAGLAAQVGMRKKQQLGDFKLVGSMWSPAPWLKRSSGSRIKGHDDPLPRTGAAWPFIWNGTFAGGVMDTSGTPRAEFDDRALGGDGPTSALTQFARGLSAFLRGFQRTYGVTLYAISIQNELNFEEFYSSCAYPLSTGYAAALKAARAELDRYPDLRAIRIMGPEDLIGGDGYGMWEYRSDHGVTHRNLQYLDHVMSDPAAARALDFACIHGYAFDGVSSAGAEPKIWDYWVNGWDSSPAPGLPARVKGFADFGKKSWMTETSGEQVGWLAPAGAFPSDGAFSIALKIHQALTAGRESAWIYWQLTSGGATGVETLTDAKARENSPKYIAAKHFFRFIRPGAVRVQAAVSGSDSLLASAYAHGADKTLSVVLVNASKKAISATLQLGPHALGVSSLAAYTSKDGSYLRESKVAVAATNGTARVAVPGYGVVTLTASGIELAAARSQANVSSALPVQTARTTGGSCSCRTAGASGSRSSKGMPAACGVLLGSLALRMLALRRARRRAT